MTIQERLARAEAAVGRLTVRVDELRAENAKLEAALHETWTQLDAAARREVGRPPVGA